MFIQIYWIKLSDPLVLDPIIRGKTCASKLSTFDTDAYMNKFALSYSKQANMNVFKRTGKGVLDRFSSAEWHFHCLEKITELLLR